MTLRELIAKLQKLEAKHGDIDVLRWDCTPPGGDFGAVMKASDVQLRAVYWANGDKDAALLQQDANYRQQAKAVLL